jgi:gamma-glutamylcyclotransferase (GGCT)/AIG2-like uncharacterized protein YtfP
MSDQCSLFIYGSLRLGFRNPAFEYISKYFNRYGEGKIKGKFFFNGNVPVAVPCNEEKYITGEVYTLKNPEDLNWVIIQLDDYEGVNVEPGETPLYKRELVNVIMENETITPWVYWYNRSVENMQELDAAELSAHLGQQNKPL